ncbi:MAG: 5-formyltetrahydrofolate cyclo-ligase [Sphingobacteriales bacterium]|nr:5-formyltetrahydrofolate cyclo-ligase [Sphingobacteriales bacterium]
MTKAALRKLYKEKRLLLTSSEINRFNDLILIHFQHLDIPFIYYLHTYLAIEESKEVPTDQVISYLEFRNPDMKVIIPKADFESRQLTHFLLEYNTRFQANEFNIPEPVDGIVVTVDKLDMVLVPLLAFDEKGYRVGYGKGFYDRFLAQCRKDTLMVGLSYFEAVDSISDTHEFDLPLTHCVTPHRIYEFG